MAKTQRYLILFRNHRQNAKRHNDSNEWPKEWVIAHGYRAKACQRGIHSYRSCDELKTYTRTQSIKAIDDFLKLDVVDWGYQMYEYKLLKLSNG